jgi:acetyl-CoA acetyltransferase
MGETAENLANELNVSREDQDIFAINSHRKALDAWNNGRFDDEVAPIEFNGTTVSKDECPRQPDEDKIKSLDPAFVEGGSVTEAPIEIGLEDAAVTEPPSTKAGSRLLILSSSGCLGHSSFETVVPLNSIGATSSSNLPLFHASKAFL